MSLKSRAAYRMVYRMASPLLRAAVPPNSSLRRRLGNVAEKIRPTSNNDPLHQLVSAYALAHPRAFFLQIGAHDTQQLDPLHLHLRKRGWRGILVEPIPYVFARLQNLWGDNHRLVLENVAIADHDGDATIFYIPQSGDEHLPIWYDALASFRRDVVLKHRDYIPDIDSRIAEMLVPVMTFESLCAKHGVQKLDVIQMDTEGYDFEIIKQIDLERYRPTIVMYESLHLPPLEQEACLRHFRAHGYEALVSPMDTFCLRPADLTLRDLGVRRLWARLRSQPSPFLSAA